MGLAPRRRWIACAAIVAAGCGLVAVSKSPRFHSRLRAIEPAHGARASDSAEATPALAHAEPAPTSTSPPEPPPPPWTHLDVLHLRIADGAVVAASDAGIARLTLDPALQAAVEHLLAAHHVPEAAAVVLDVASGRALAYASHLEEGPPRDLCAEATAPSASVFKVVTAAALVEDAHLDAATTECYSGGEQRISLADLAPDPRRDRWCTTLAGAMGRSVNTVFARLAKDRLSPGELEAMARRFGFGETLPFDVPVQPSELRVPREPLEFARTAAGFWNTTLSPIAAAAMSATVARGGERARPTLVDAVTGPAGDVVWSAPPGPRTRAVIARATAEELTSMMERTVRDGTCSRAFHDGRGRAFLPGIVAAGKTGTLTDAAAQRTFTWFTGFAPVEAVANAPEVAVAVLVVNGPAWQVKANVVGRDILRAYFAARGAPGVTSPDAGSVARNGGATRRNTSLRAPKVSPCAACGTAHERNPRTTTSESPPKL